MNAPVHPLLNHTTLAAEGLPRRSWTLDDIERMVSAGIIDESERFELIGGEIVPMSPKGVWHEDVKRVLAIHWARSLPPDLTMLTETTLRIAPGDFRESDFVFWPSAVPVKDLAPSHVLLLVEVADSSLDYDLGRKAAYYAAIGIPDYWVVDAKRLAVHVHRSPGEGGYADVFKHPATASIVPLHVPQLAVCLAGLGLQPLSE